MRQIMTITILCLLWANTITASDQFILWSSTSNAVKVEFSKDQGETQIGKDGHLYMLKWTKSEPFLFSNISENQTSIRLFHLNSGQTTDWFKLAPSEHISIEDLLPKGTAIKGERNLWESITTFVTTGLKYQKKPQQIEQEALSRRIAIRERALAKKADDISFTTDNWMVFDKPEDINIGWQSRFPLQSVILRDLKTGENILSIKNLGFYRLQYDGLDPAVKKQLKGNRKYELLVNVTTPKGDAQTASVRFSLSKSLTFSPFMERKFMKNQFEFNWTTKYDVTEILFIDTGSQDTLIHQKDVDKNGSSFKLQASPGSYGITPDNIGAEIELTRGNNYRLVVAISDEIGSKRLFSTELYCKTREETIVEALGNNQETYKSLVSFAELVEPIK